MPGSNLKRAPIPVTLIGGFLGAGKTTLLNHILSADHGVRAAVLVNDFGAINIDAQLVVGIEDDTVELANGCVCCTIRDDLASACLALLKRPLPPEYLLIELSGVSEPIPVINTLNETDLAGYYKINSILSVVDASQFAQMTGEMAQLAQTQLGAADIIVLNKADLVGSDQLEHVKSLVHKLTSGAKLIDCVKGQIPFELAFSGVYEDVERRYQQVLPAHGNHSHGQDFASWSWSCDRPLSLPALRSALESLPDTIYRCKGIVCLEEAPVYRYVLQMVGKRYQIEESGSWDKKPRKSEIVLIGGRKAIDEAQLKKTFEDCVGTGDDAQSPTLRLIRKLAPELLRET